MHPTGAHYKSRSFNTCARVREAHVAILAKINGQQAKISGRYFIGLLRALNALRAYGYPSGAPISRFHFVKLLPLRGRHVGTHFARFHFVIIFFAGSFGPSNGHPIGHPCGHPYGAPTFQKGKNLGLVRVSTMSHQVGTSPSAL